MEVVGGRNGTCSRLHVRFARLARVGWGGGGGGADPHCLGSAVGVIPKKSFGLNTALCGPVTAGRSFNGDSDEDECAQHMVRGMGSGR